MNCAMPMMSKIFYYHVLCHCYAIKIINLCIFLDLFFPKCKLHTKIHYKHFVTAILCSVQKLLTAKKNNNKKQTKKPKKKKQKHPKLERYDEFISFLNKFHFTLFLDLFCPKWNFMQDPL